MTKKVTITTLPSTRKLLEDAMGIMEADLIRYKKKVRDPETELTPAEARTITTYIAALTSIEKNERDAMKAVDDGNLNEDELLDKLLSDKEFKQKITQRLKAKES